MSVLTEVLKLFKYDPATDGDMTFNIGQCMNDNWDKLDAAILLAIAAAGAYNPEESYAVGDYCTYKGKLRKCSTAIPTGETWTEAHWTTTTVAAELAELSSQLSNKMGYVANATGFADLSDMPDESCVCLTAISGVVGLPDGWPTTGRNTFVRFRPGNKQYALDFLLSYNSDKLAYRIPSRKWREFPIATPPQVRNLTLQPGFTANGGCIFFKTQENVVFLGGGVSGTIPANQDVQIGILPAGFCPSEDYRRDAVTDAGTAYIRIGSDGTVNIHSLNAAGSYAFFSAAFVADTEGEE